MSRLYFRVVVKIWRVTIFNNTIQDMQETAVYAKDDKYDKTVEHVYMHIS